MTPTDAANGIQALVAARGGVRFRDFMELALYHPEHGYYGAGRARLGREGDFFTNVSVGAIFGELMARQFLEMWERLGRPEGFAIVEQGANDGTFAADVLEWCRREAREFFDAVRYEIVEGLEILRARQDERLREFAGKVVWRAGLEELPPFTGVHFSNELVDAFPVHLVRYRAGEWRELWVTPDLAWDEKAAPEDLRNALWDVPQIDGYTTEVNLEAARWALSLAGKIQSGWILTIDYGFPRERYYSPERHTGTLECYAGHAKGLDPLSKPGFCDLTAHVEFTGLARSFRDAGMGLAGFTDQHHFLTGLAAQAFSSRTPTPQEARGLKTLLHPEMLGRVFQVLGMERNTPGGKLTGFAFARDAQSLLSA
jgi:SAM-dependent MidA family methyltransferase